MQVRNGQDATASSGGELSSAETPGQDDRARPGRGVVLVADDDEAVLLVARGLLESLGFEVLTATDGLEAVAAFRQRRDRIVAVLLDVAMPRLDGIGALRELRHLEAEVPVILCTGYSEVEAKARLGDAPAEAYLEKPFNLGVLRDRLRAVLRG
jgi:CheY-like chemotaxis protein